MSSPPSSDTSGSNTDASSSASTSINTLKLQVKTMKGGTFSITVPQNGTVADIQRAIQESQSVPIDHQRLIHKGKVLKSDQPLSSFALEDGDCLHMIVSQKPPPTESPSAAAATPSSQPSAAAAAGPMPNLTPNNAIPTVPLTPFGLGGIPGMQIFQMPVGPGGAGGGMPQVDIQQILNGVFGALAGPQGAGGAPIHSVRVDIQVPPGGGQPIINMPPGIPTQLTAVAPTPAATRPATTPAATPQHQQQQQQPPQQQQQQQQPAQPQSQPQVQPQTGRAPASGAQQPVVGSPSFGVGLPGGVHVMSPHPSSHPPLTVNAVRTFLSEVAQHIPRITSAPPLSMDPRATMSNAAVQNATFPESLAGLVQLLAQTQAVVTQVSPPLLYRLQNEVDRLTTPISSANSSSSHPETAQSRLALQAQLRQVAPGLRRIGDSLRGLATLIEAIQVNPQTGDSSLLILPPHLQPGRQVAVTTAPSMQPMQAMHFNMGAGMPGQPIVMNFGQPGAGQPFGVTMQQQQNPQQQQQPVVNVTSPTPAATTPAPSPATSTPAATPNQPASTPAANNATPAASPVGPINFMSLLQQATPMLGPIMQNLQQSMQQAQRNAPAGGQPQAGAGGMQDIMAALGPMFAGLQAQPVGPNAPQTPPSQQPRMAAPAPTSANVEPARSAAPAPAPTTPAAAPNLAGLFSSFAPMLGQMLNNPSAAGGGGSLQSIISNLAGALNPPGSSPSNANSRSNPDRMEDVDDDQEEEDNEDGDQPASLFDMFLSTMTQHLSLPDLMGLISGNWSGLARVHGPFRELVMDLLADEDTDSNRSLLSHSFASGIVDSMLDGAIIAPVASQLIEGADPKRATSPVVRLHVRRLIDLILDTPVAEVPPPPAPLPPATPNSFSTKVKQWCTDFCGHWLVVLGSCYRDGLTSSERIANSIVQTKFSSVGGSEMAMFLPMVSGTITQVMMRAARTYQQSQMLASTDGSSGGDAAWLLNVPPEHRQRWKQTIEEDEKKLEQEYNGRMQPVGSAPTRSLYRPLSSSYLSGRKGKRSAASGAESSNSSGSSASSSSTSSVNAPDTRIADNLSRTLRGAIESVQPSTSSEQQGTVQRVIDSIPEELLNQYTQQVAQDLRTTIASQFSGDYSPQRFPNTEAEIRPNK